MYPYLIIMVVIVSIDCGSRNLAHCVYDSDNSILCEWRVSVLCSTRAPIASLVKSAAAWATELYTRNPDIRFVYIEQQPVANTRMKCLSHAIQAALLAHAPHVHLEFVSARVTHGILGIGGNNRSYAARKQAAVAWAARTIASKAKEDATWGKWASFWATQHKRDDLADSLAHLFASVERHGLKKWKSPVTHQQTRRQQHLPPREQSAEVEQGAQPLTEGTTVF